MFRFPIDVESFPLGKGPMVMLVLFFIIAVISIVQLKLLGIFRDE